MNIGVHVSFQIMVLNFKGLERYSLAQKREDFIILDTGKGMCEDSEVRTRKWCWVMLWPLL